MAAPNNKGNFKTYEGQARLLRAMVAAHPEVKWNCKGTYIFSRLLNITPHPTCLPILPLAAHFFIP